MGNHWYPSRAEGGLCARLTGTLQGQREVCVLDTLVPFKSRGRLCARHTGTLQEQREVCVLDTLIPFKSRGRFVC